MRTQAERTIGTLSSECLSPAPHSASITMFKTLSDKELLSSKQSYNSNINSVCESKDTHLNETENILTEPLQLFNKDSLHVAHVSSLRSDLPEIYCKGFAIPENNDICVKDMLTEFEKKNDIDDCNVPNSTYNNTNEEVSTLIGNLENIFEENYMSMTPKKNILDSSASHDTTLYVDTEENSYVEMTKCPNTKNLETDNVKSFDQRSYEMIYFSNGKSEPVYMELRQSSQDILNENKNLLIKLPDILIPSKINKSNKSDSSDADDEASKDLDSLDAPNHPRFSLSDTFRPASYYLGASQIATELQDSSDSELVSPPPIPRSPPLDELDECTSSNQELSLTEQDKMYKYSNVNSEQYLNESTKIIHAKKNMQVLDIKGQSFLSSISTKDIDNSSLCSIITDTETHINSRLSHNSDSDVEIRNHLYTSSDYEQMLKRRPVSKEYCDEFEFLDSPLSDDIEEEFRSKYVHKSHTDSNTSNDNERKSKCSMQSNYHDYENYFVSQQLKRGSLFELNTDCIHTKENSQDNLSSKDTIISQESGETLNAKDCNYVCINSENNSSNEVRSQNDLSSEPLKLGDYSSILFYEFAYQPIGAITTEGATFSTSNVNVGKPSSSHDVLQTRGTKVKDFNQPAPYYYSDLSVNTSGTDSTILTLNNQRNFIIGNKRDITHIINPIRCTIQSSRNSSHNIQQNIENNSFKLAVEARSASVDFLNLTNKHGQIDKKNIYESDTLKRLKAMDSITSLQSTPETRNLYPTSRDEKFFVTNPMEIVIRRSQSLEGLLENVLHESGDNYVAQSSSLAESNSYEVKNENDAVEGNYLWDEDSVWHECLRSASQRHTKSLDDLDNIGKPMKKMHKKQLRGIKRTVTYVNDNICNMPLYDKHQKCNEAKHFEEKNESKVKDSFILDREKLRQWDLMSSAPDADAHCSQAVRVNMVVDVEDVEDSAQDTDRNNIQNKGTIIQMYVL